MESKDELSHSKRHDADGGGGCFFLAHGGGLFSLATWAEISTCLTQQTGANCGAKTSAARLAAASLPIRSMGHKRSPLQKVSQKFCGQPKSQLPRYQYLDWSKASPTASPPRFPACPREARAWTSPSSER